MKKTYLWKCFAALGVTISLSFISAVDNVKAAPEFEAVRTGAETETEVFCVADNVMNKAFTVDNNDKEPILKSLGMKLYDADDQLIEESTFTDLQMHEIRELDIPVNSYTSWLTITELDVGGGPGVTTSLMLGGKEYQLGEKIPRNLLIGEDLLTITLTSPSGCYTTIYTANISFGTTVLDDGNGNQLVDENGFFPMSTGYDAQIVGNGPEYEALASGLNELGGRDQFRPYKMAVKKGDGTPFALTGEQKVFIKFAIPQDYDVSKTRLYYLDTSGAKGVLTDVTDDQAVPGTDFIQSVPINDINGYYALSVVKDLPKLPVLDPVVYSPAQTLGDVSFPSSDQGSWTWDKPDETPEVKTVSYAAVFTPVQGSPYASYKTMIPLPVTPAKPVISAQGAKVTYGQALKDSALSGEASCDGVVLSGGNFKWADDSQLPVVNNQGYEVLYTPDPADMNYEPVTGTASIQVGKKAVTVEASPAKRQYGDANPKFVFTVPEDVLVGNDSEDALGVVLSSPANESSPVGDYDITGVSASDNYEVSVTPSALAVTKRPAKLIPADVTITYKEKIPQTFDFTVEGLVNQDQPSAVKADLSAKADEKSPAGTYEITGTASAENYDITVQTGHLTIKPIVLSKDTGIENRSSLPDNLAGKTAVAGSFDTSRESRIVISDVPADSAAYKAIKEAASKFGELILVCDIQLEKVENINEKMVVTLGVGSRYDGRKVTVYHYITKGEKDKNGTVVSRDTLDEYKDLTVKDGTVSVEAYSLLSFGIALQDAGRESDHSSEKPGTNVIPRDKSRNLPIGAETGDNTPAAAVLTILTAALAATVICMLAIRKRYRH